MQLTIATTEGVARGEVKLIEIARDALMTTVAELISAELSIAPGNQRLLLNGAPLSMAGTASDRGLSDGDLVLVENTSPPPAAGAGPEAVEQLRSIMQNPQAQAQLRARNPAMARAIESGDEGALSQLASQLQAMIAQGHGRGGGGGGAPAPPGSDNPMSVEAQTAMMEHIRQQNVEKNMEQAIEHNPEAFGSVVMLFVDCKINNIAGVKAFVDSGAQATIISKACAQRCNLLRLLDTRFQGMARGVGTAKIYGRIHLSTLTLGEEFFDVTFIVMESVGGDYDMLLGLDMLRKHQASIDLRENCLRIGGAVVPFLQEKVRLHSLHPFSPAAFLQ